MKRLIALLLALCLMLPAAVLAEETEPVPESQTEVPITAPQRTLVKGMNGPDVLGAQIRLSQYGYYTGPLDSSFGSVMLTAVKQFQRRNELAVDGKIGPKTLAVNL